MTVNHEDDNAPLTGISPEELGTDSAQETVGQSDAAADAARTGADMDGMEQGGDVSRDSDGVPVGDADADEDARRAGA